MPLSDTQPPSTPPRPPACLDPDWSPDENQGRLRGYPFPIRSGIFGDPIPDLKRIPRARWREALALVSSAARAAAGQGLLGDREAVMHVAQLELVLPPARWEPPTPTPGIPAAQARGTGGGGAGRQLNVRLRPDDHEALVRAARLFAMTPTQLARTFIVDGARRALAERQDGG